MHITRRNFLIGAQVLAAMVMSIAAPSTVLAATLHLAGDSTLDDCGFKYPYRSWGREVETYLKSGNVIANLAKSGHSTKSFDTDGEWAKLMAEVKPGDFVIMQFGHNDQKRSTQFYIENRWAAPDGLYKDILRRWVGEVRAKGATPILASPICRGTFDADGKKLVDTTHSSPGVCLRTYRDAMESLANELSCDFVDMNTLTKDLMESLGREESEKFFVISTGAVRGKDGEPSRDVTHPAKAGAETFARLFVDDVKARGLSVAKLFKNDDFSILDFGAKPDGSKCTEAFAAAFAAAEKAGGGRVIVPRGKWFTGAIRFRSNCELHLEDSAEVLFSQDPDDYLPAVFTSWEGMECWNYCPLVYAYGCTNVAITGKGTLRAYEGRWEDTKWYPWVPQKNGIKAARLQLYTWGATDYPVEKREIWKMPNAHTRPHFIQFNRCRNVRLEDFKVRNSPFWTIHLYQCEDASVRGLDVYAHGNNNDGIDIEMSKNVIVEKCVFDQGDDGIVIKSGRNRDAWRINRPTENVLVRDCEIRNGHSALGIGSEISGGVRNVTLKDCMAGDLTRVFYLKTNRRRGGFLENITCKNVTARSAKISVFGIDTDVLYEWKDFPDYENRTTRISGITARNISVGSTRDVVRLCGDPALPPKDIHWENVTAQKFTGKELVLNNVVVASTASGEIVFVQDREVFVHKDNYDKSKIAPYTLEDPLTFADGRKVKSAADWCERRREILGIFAKEMYGEEPPRPETLITELTDEKPAVDGMAIRRQYRMRFKDDGSGPSINWIVWIPKFVKKPVPVISFLNFNGNHELVPDEDVPVQQGWMRNNANLGITNHSATAATRGRLQDPNGATVFPLGMILARGYAVMSACYCEVSPDPNRRESDSRFWQNPFAYTGVFELWGERDQSRTDNITSLGAWAWALSRGLDLAERIPELDAKRAVVTGCSRLGKAALIAAARDERFAVCVPNQTGGGGVPLAKRDYGENVSTENRYFTHWFCRAYAKHSEAPWKTLSFDQHLLVACIAPRALLVEGFDSPWFDAEGEYLSVRAASPVWEFLGMDGMPDVPFPDDFDTSAIGRRLGYVRRSQNHGISACDWTWLLDFADRQVKGE